MSAKGVVRKAYQAEVRRLDAMRARLAVLEVDIAASSVEVKGLEDAWVAMVAVSGKGRDAALAELCRLDPAPRVKSSAPPSRSAEAVRAPTQTTSGERLRRALRQSGKDESTFARESGVTLSAVQQALRSDSKTMREPVAERYARVLGCNSHWLGLGLEPNPSAE